MKRLLMTIVITVIAWISLRDLEQMAFAMMAVLPISWLAMGKE